MQYELVVVTDSKGNEKEMQEKLVALLEKEGFAVSDRGNWGKKPLAYPVRKHTEGMFFSFTLSGEHLNPTILTAKFKMEEYVLRSLVLRKEKIKEKNKENPKSKTPVSQVEKQSPN